MQFIRPLILLSFLISHNGGADAAEIPEPTEGEATIAHWLPQSFARLKQRVAGYKVVVIGDDVSNYNVPDPRRTRNLRNTWHWQFLELLAQHYRYTGGVQLREGSRGSKETHTQFKHDDGEDGPEQTPRLGIDFEGPILQIENLTRSGIGSLQTLEDLTTVAFDRDPDLILFMSGSNDAAQGGNLAGYRATLEEVIRTCKERKVDLILATPPLIVQKKDLRTLGLTRPLASVAREVAAANDVLCIDAGNALASARPASVSLAPDEALKNAFRRLEDRFRHPVEQVSPGAPALQMLVPNHRGQQVIAEAAWAEFSESAAAEPLLVNASLTLPVNGAGEASLELNFRPNPLAGEQNLKKPAAIAVLGLGGTWQARENLTESELASGMSNARAVTPQLAHWKLRIPCQAVPESYGGRIWGEESIIRGSLLMCSESGTRLINFNASILPMTVKFPAGRLEGAGNELPLALEVSNGLSEAFVGNAEVIWRGQSQSFAVSIPPGAPFPMKIGLPLPPPSSTRPFKSMLILKLKNDALNLAFEREIQLTPDLLLGQSVPLTNRAKYAADAPPGDPADAAATTVALQCQADDNGLYFIFDLPPIDVPTGQKQASALVDITLDARGPGKRGKPGSCPILTLEIPWQDGKFPIEKLPNGLFGAGYDRELLPSYFLASVKTLATNRRQVRLSVPRNYFYLHQWSLNGSAQSILGLNAQVSLLTMGAENAPGTYPPERTFSLVAPRLPRADASGLGLLQLAKKPPAWSAIFP